jgi:hypothetical protein
MFRPEWLVRIQPASYFKGEIMKLTSEHIGKTIQSESGELGTLLALSGEFIWVHFGKKELETRNAVFWSLVEEPKRASEEIYDKASKNGYSIQSAILDWLDENWTPK